MSENVKAIVHAITSTTIIQTIALNLGVSKIRLYIRRTLVLVIPTAGHVRISSTNVVCVCTVSP